jgi:hypothetical protein
MAEDLSKGLRESPFHNAGTGGQRTGQPVAIDLVIGIDYGTRFTKIAIGDGAQRQVWADESQNRLIPSIVYAAADGTVMTYPDRAPLGSDKIEYLKMLLADPNIEAFRGIRSHVNGKSIRDVVRPLAALFLNGLVRSAQSSLLRKRPELGNRKINWFLNLSAPVAHCDSNITAFKEVAAVAFEWAKHAHPTKLKIDDLCASYDNTLGSLDIANSPASVVPELTAALHEFLRDPNRADSLYGLFDIGGGTVDGTIFRINRSGIGLPLVIFAARVDYCGTMAVSRTMLAEIYSRLPHYFESTLLGPDEHPKIGIPLAEPLAFRDKRSVRDEIQILTSSIIFQTSRKLYGQMFSPRVDATKRDTPALRVFLSGGGATSGWYKSSIEKAFVDRNLSQFGLTGIRSEIVPSPADYRQSDYPRFVIALGLADFASALTDARLPNQIGDRQAPPERRSPEMITKDHV